MSAGPLAARAEILRLARVLDVEPGALAGLEDLPADDLRTLRHQIVDALFDDGHDHYERLTAAVRVLPGPLVATIAQRAFGPALCARVAGRLDAKRAADLARRLPHPFLADLCTNLDPRRSGEVIARIPAREVRGVARELMANGEHVTAASLVVHLDPGVLDDVLAVIADDDLLRIAFVIDDLAVVDDIVARTPEVTLRGILRTALAGDLWAEGLALLLALSDAGQARLVPLLEDELAAAPASIRKRALALAEDLGVVADLGPLEAALRAD